MDTPYSYAEGMAQATMVLLLRAGLLEGADILALADEYDRRASWEGVAQAKEAMEQTAHGLRLALMSTDEAPMIDPRVEGRAQFERQQTRQRTAMIERDAGCE